jgi:hypothetical protein
MFRKRHTPQNCSMTPYCKPRRQPAFVFALLLSLCALTCASSQPATAQNPATEALPSPAARAVLNVVRWTGNLPEAAGQTVEVHFALYQDQAGGLPLWRETQPVKVGADGRYTVLLGASAAEGLPTALFQGGLAKWIEARPLSATPATANATPPARTLLAAVPYAFKSVDAENLAGRAAADYVTRDELQSAVAGSVQAAAQINPQATLGGAGTVNYVPLWTAAATLGNSVIAQSAAKVGIGIAAPATTLDVNGATTLRSTVNLHGTSATATAGVNSPALQLGASAYSSATKAAVAQNFLWQAVSAGNNTAAPTANLNLQFATGAAAPVATGLAISPKGQITFAAGQKFPGTGAITAITATSPLTGGGTSGAITLGLNTTALRTTLNPVYAQLGTANIFTAANTFAVPVTFAAGQKFPGAGSGTITGVTAGTGLKGGGTTGAVTLTLDTTKVPQLSAYNTFAAGASFGGETWFTGASTDWMLVTTNTSATAKGTILGQAAGNQLAIEGASPGGIGVLGATDAGVGVEGTSTGTGLAGSFTSSDITQPTVSVANQGGGPGVSASSTTGSAGSFSSAGTYSATVYAINNADGNAGAFYNNSPGRVALAGTNIAPDSTAIGTYGNVANGDAVYGIATGGGTGVYGSTLSTSAASEGIYGIAAKGDGVYGTSDPGTGVYGVSVTGEGMHATSISGNGIGASSETSYAVYGFSYNYTGGYFGTENGAVAALEAQNYGTGTVHTLFSTFKASSNGGICGIGSGGDLSCTGQVKTLVSAAGGARTVETYAVQSPENWMEDFGSGTLQRGVAVVQLDPAFAETVTADASYHVFLTPRGDSKGLYVIHATATGFEVRESGGGTSSLAFDYRIVGKRRGYEAQRLTDVTARFNAEAPSPMNVPARPAPRPQQAPRLMPPPERNQKPHTVARRIGPPRPAALESR